MSRAGKEAAEDKAGMDTNLLQVGLPELVSLL